MAQVHSATTGARSADLHPVLRDFVEAFRLRRIWLRFSWMDIRLRYRRSYLGPLWLTINHAIYIIAIGTIFGFVLQGARADYLPYFCLGYILWQFIAHAIIEGCDVFNQSAKYILQMKLPYPMWLYQLLWRNVLAFLHMLPIYVVVALIYNVSLSVENLFVLPFGLILILANVGWASLVLAILCLRYRDLARLVQSVVQVAFLATPIIWTVDRLGEHGYIAAFNPLYHLLEVVRSPLLGTQASLLSWTVNVAMALVGWLVALILYGRTRHRIAFWL